MDLGFVFQLQELSKHCVMAVGGRKYVFTQPLHHEQDTTQGQFFFSGSFKNLFKKL